MARVMRVAGGFPAAWLEDSEPSLESWVETADTSHQTHNLASLQPTTAGIEQQWVAHNSTDP
jgi:hypothetical protein